MASAATPLKLTKESSGEAEVSPDIVQGRPRIASTRPKQLDLRQVTGADECKLVDSRRRRERLQNAGQSDEISLSLSLTTL